MSQHLLAAVLHDEADRLSTCDCLDKILARARRNPPAATSPAAGPGRCIYRTAWRCWAAGVLASFVVIELPGLRTEGGHGTLTFQLRRNRRLSAACIAAFAIWAIDHVARQGSEIKEARSC
ncbi:MULTISPECIES: hypothetical protein [unclassified Nonomuraea]|uniref:hypothetical protein n=1 Tax=unclassified Nonomuraea TaxID=2593643 RepID=UPI0033D4E583